MNVVGPWTLTLRETYALKGVAMSASLSGFLPAIVKTRDLVHRYHPASHHSVEHPKERLDLFLTVHDFDDHRQVHRKTKNLGRVEAAGFAKAHRTAQHRCAGQVHLARLEHDGFVERLVLPTVAFADKDAQQNCVVRNLHVSFLSCARDSPPAGRQARPQEDITPMRAPHLDPRKA